jgi:molybdate transport system substrate-binding protein
MKESALAAAASMLQLAIALWPVASVRATELRILAGGGIAGPLNEIVAQYERASGHKIVVRYGTAPELIKLLSSGVPFDLAVVPEEVWKDATARARAVPGLIPEVARVGIGVAVRLGAAKPDIGTVEAFRQTLLETQSIASIPASATGTLLSGIYQRLGITNEMKAKTKAQATTGGIVEAVANGDAQLALFILNVLIDPRLDVVGPLPAELQRELVYAACVAANSNEPDAAKTFLAYLMSPAAISVIKAKGMSPG